MPKAIPWSESELQALVSNPASRIFLDQKKIRVVLQPFHLQDLKSAVRDLLNASVESYDKSLEGILLSYKHLKILSRSASVAAETSGVVIEIQADFYVFRPEVGCELQGVVNKLSKDHVGVLLYQRFNVSCPRPGSEARSEQWLGNGVVKNQEVTFKLKEMNYSGKIPFFRAKLKSCGRILSEDLEEENKKSKKKKKEKQDESNKCETPSTSATAAPKILKHKLEESDRYGEAKVKKSKKEKKLDESIQTSLLENMKHVAVETPSKKKTKRVSISTVDETDFIPRFSLDVSQLPENLPPPNADSTHFDLGRNISSLNIKSEKKKKQNHEGLSLIREESSQSNKSLTVDSSSKIQHSSLEKIKKKKDKKIKSDFKLPDVSLDESRHKEIYVKDCGASSHVAADTDPLSDTVRKRKQKSNGQEEASPKKKKSKNEKVSRTSLLNPAESASLVNDGEGSNIFAHAKNSMAPEWISKSKKKHKESKEELVPTPSKQKKEKKEKVKPDRTDDTVASDETIPPGQRVLSGSPQKRVSLGSSQKQLSFSTSIVKSPGIGYFAGSTSLGDIDLGTRKGARAAPLTFGNFEGKVLPPPESPMKSPPPKKYGDSDSDTSVPKRVVVSASVRRDSDNSDDSEEDERKAVPESPSRTNHVKQQRMDSDDSDSNVFVRNRFLQSMGVMQSPLKSAKPTLKQDTSDSDSDQDTYVRKNNKMLIKSPKPPPLSKSKESSVESNANLKLKPPKPFKDAETKNKSEESSTTQKKSKLPPTPQKAATPSKQSKQASLVPSKSNRIDSPAANVEDSDSSTDAELIKNALRDLEQEKITGTKLNPKLQNKKAPGGSKKGVKAPSVNTMTTIEKKSVPKSSAKVLSDKSTSVGTSKSKSFNDVSYDSDSGPDDRNTTKNMEEMRQRRADEEGSKTKKPAKQPKVQKSFEPNTSNVDPKKKKNETKQAKKGKEIDASNAEVKASAQGIPGKDSTKGKKAKAKSKKNSADDDIHNVMQKLLKEALVGKGLA